MVHLKEAFELPQELSRLMAQALQSASFHFKTYDLPFT